MVKLFTKPSCQQCNATKRALDTAKIQYEIVDVSVDNNALNVITSMGFRSAPVVVTETDSWAGFRPEKIAELSNHIYS